IDNGTGNSTQFSMTNLQAATTTALSSNPNPSYLTQPVTYSAAVSSAAPSVVPTGGVQYSFDGVPAGAPVSVGPAGRADLPAARVPALAVGSRTVKAVYLGDVSHSGSQDTGTQTIRQMPTAVAVTSG